MIKSIKIYGIIFSILLCVSVALISCSTKCSHIESEWIIDSESTFDTAGQQHIECTQCLEILKIEAIPQKTCAHNETEWVTTAEPTFEKDGAKYEKCLVCKKTLNTESISKKICNHNDTKWITVKEATFSAEGSRYEKCLVCEKTLKTEIIPIKICSHTNTEWIITSNPTYDTVGSKYQKCSICGKTITTQIIPKLEKGLTQTEISNKLEDSIVKVICYDYDGETEISQGSGFFIDNKGTFITNAHVVKDAYFIKIKTYLGMTYDVNKLYVYNYSTSDYAICGTNLFVASATPVEFADSANIDDTVYALGFPNDSFFIKTTKGKIESTNAVEGTRHYYSNTASIDHGSSGGILANNQGQVLGITTASEFGGKYLALKYQDFKYDAERSHFSAKTPLEYFHTVKEIRLNSFNADQYFDIIVNGNASSSTSVNYLVTVKLKDKYRYAKLIMDSISVSLSLNLNTTFDYYEETSYGSPRRKSDTEREYLNFWFRDENSLIRGETQSARSSIFISSMNNYYNMDISYDTDISLASGTLLIYD